MKQSLSSKTLGLYTGGKSTEEVKNKAEHPHFQSTMCIYYLLLGVEGGVHTHLKEPQKLQNFDTWKA